MPDEVKTYLHLQGRALLIRLMEPSRFDRELPGLHKQLEVAWEMLDASKRNAVGTLALTPALRRYYKLDHQYRVHKLLKEATVESTEMALLWQSFSEREREFFLENGCTGILDLQEQENLQEDLQERTNSNMLPTDLAQALPAVLTPDELFEALTTEPSNAGRLFISAKVVGDELILVRANLDIRVIPIDCFANMGLEDNKPDLNDISLIDHGQTLKLGAYEISSDVINMLPLFLLDGRRTTVKGFMKSIKAFGKGDPLGVSSDPESLMSLAALAQDQFFAGKTYDRLIEWSSYVCEVEDIVDTWDKDSESKIEFLKWVEEQFKVIEQEERALDGKVDNGMYTEGYL